MAITDPGSKMQHLSEADGFRRIFFGQPTIGGRFSVLSDFGMVPAAIMGLDIGRLLGQAEQMAHSCAASVPVTENPGVALGILMGVAARQGHNKVTLIASPGAQALGSWIEQLMSASLGKAGGLLAIEGEPVGAPATYGNDRLFVYLRFDPAPDAGQDTAVAALEAAGMPVVRITLTDPYELGAEFFRWQFATAVAGAVLGLNPFDQPDIEASKMASRRHTNEFSRTGALAPETPLREGEGLTLFADAANAVELGRERSVAGALGAHLRRARPGDYVALLAFLEPNAATEAELRALRGVIRDRLHVATSLGLGPRYLHSTGQAYKGGPTRRVPHGDGGRYRRRAGSHAEVQLRGGQGGAGSRRPPGAGRARPPRGARPPGPRPRAGLVALRTALERALA